ncbi:MAG: Gfo/Idh/MocA family oxidoreductase [Clostridiales bacterium]|nr:Gfo/Idh/MocA family oxidoreductase [Clostridiales bacterium]
MKKKVAIVGYGGMGGWHARYALKSDVIQLAGIYDIKETRNDAARTDGIHVYASYSDMIADPDVEIVIIVTPNEVHLPQAVEAMAAGKHVVSEKPVALSSKELAEMIDASVRYNRIFTVHQNRRWDGDFLAMKKLYQTSNDLGEIFNIESRVHGSRGIPGDWRGMKKHGGGMLLDWGVHLIDQILQMEKSKISRIYCRFDHITNDEVDDGFKLDLMFENGLIARVEVGTSNFIKLPRFYMQGTNGTAIIRDWTSNCEVVCCKNNDEKDVKPVVTAAGLTKTMAPRTEDSVTQYEFELQRPDVHDFYRNVCAAIDGKEELIVKHDEVMRVMKVMEAAMESDRLGQVVDFNG